MKACCSAFFAKKVDCLKSVFLAMFMLLGYSAQSIDFNESTHIRANYDPCTGKIVIEFVYYDKGGDDDEVDWAKVYFKNSSNSWDQMWEWNEDSRGGWTKDETGGADFWYSSGFGQSVTRDWFYWGNNSDVVANKLTWNDVPAYAYTNGSVEVRIEGFYNGDGSDPEVSFDKPITVTIPKANAPSNLIATDEKFCDHVALSWTNASNPSCSPLKTEIYRDGTRIAIVNAGVEAYSDYGATQGVVHEYKLRHFEQFSSPTRYNYTDYSTNESGSVIPLPIAPVEFEASDDDCGSTIKLSWRYEPDIENYRIYKKSSTGTLTLLETIGGNNSSYTYKSAVKGESTTFRIIAKNGCGDGSPSEATGISPADPDKPTSVVATEVPGVGVRITWDNINNEDGYLVERNLLGGGGANFKEMPQDATTYLDESMKICQTYEYRVLSTNYCKPNGVPSDAIATIKLTPDLSNTFDQGAFTASKGFYSNRVELKWTVAENENFLSGYKIYRRELGDPEDSTVIASLTSGSNIYIDNLVEAGLIYEYFIVGEAQCENTTIYSNVVSDVGFRSPFGTITGNVTYTGGIAVKGAQITAESTSQLYGKSLDLDGTGELTVANKPNQDLSNQVLLEAWINPENHTADFTLFEKPGTYSLKHNAAASRYEFTVNYNSGTSRTLFLPHAEIAVGNYTHLAAQVKNDSLMFFVNGEKRASTFAASGLTIDNSTSSLKIGTNYTGLLDEVRIWNTGKDSLAMLQDHLRIMVGGESGLVMYLRADENTGNYAYDISKKGNIFNRNHAAFSGGISHSTVIPTSNQLGVRAYTNSVGNYIMVLPYSGSGETFVLTPSYLAHNFEPSTRALYVGDGSAVHNNIDFKDISSFKVTGSLFYHNSSCPVEGAFVKVDGEIVIVDGTPAQTKVDGTFQVQVPIGEHFIEMEKPGHVFSVGRFPATGKYNFQRDLAMPSPSFQDSTLVKVVGRVVGGLREGNKVPGLGRSKNNIGTARLIFKSQLGNGCSTDTVFTDAQTGEYVTFLPPLKYVPTVDVVNNPTIDFGVLNLVDISQEPNLKTARDSVFNVNGGLIRVDSVQYHKRLDYIHRVDPQIDVRDPDGIHDFIGDTLFTTINKTTGDTLVRNLRQNPFRWPVFHEGDDDFKYRCLIKVYEQYVNFDRTPNPVDSVPCTDGVLQFNNQLSHLPNVQLELSKANTPDSLKFIVYTFKPGTPDFTINQSIPEYSFTRKFELNLLTGDGKSIPWEPVTNPPTGGVKTFTGYMLGSKTDGAQFVTYGPQVPEYVLRDPPGSNSSASREVGTTKSQEDSWSWNLGGKAHTEDKISLGAKFNVGIGVSTATEIENNNTAGFSASVSGGNSGSISIVTTNTEEWGTNEEPELPGASSDVYIGKSKNLQFGIAEHLTLVPVAQCAQVECLGAEFDGYRFAKKYGLSIVPGGYETHFIYSENHIQNYLIPDLINLRNTMLQSNGKYVSKLPISSPNYGKNNDDKAFGDKAVKPDVIAGTSTNLPGIGFKTLSGPSYTYNATNLADSLQGDSVRLINNQIIKWEEAIKLNEWEKVNINNQAVIDSLKEAELEQLKDDYKQVLDAYYALIAVNGVGGVAVSYGLIATPVPGTAFVGYATFAVTTAAGIAQAELFEEFQEYQQKKERIEKRFAQASPKNFSVSGGNTYTSSISHESGATYTRSVEYSMSASFKVEVSGKVNNNGVGFEKGIELEYSSGRDWSETETETETVSFTLNDPDQGDFFSVDVYQSILGWGPVFKTRAGGRTSCPHEDKIVTDYYKPGTVISERTLQREKPGIAAAPTILYNVPVEEEAVFNLTLANNTESGDDMIYDVELISSSNPFGAFVRLDGQNPYQSITIPSGTSLNKVLSVGKGPGPVYNYDSLLVLIHSQCQFAAGTSDGVDIVDSVYISAHFLPTCTKVGLSTPENQWVLNNSFNDTLPVAISEYNINFFDLESIRFDYKPTNQSSWIGLQTFHKDTTDMGDPDLKLIPTNTPFTLYDWEVAQLTDGTYDVRVVSNCTLADKTSVTYTGIIDRINPHPFGTPSPADGILDANDDISIKFNEDIDLGSLTLQNFDIRGVLNGTETDHSTSLFFDGMDDYAEIPGGIALANRDFTIALAARRAGRGEEALISQGIDNNERLFIGFNDADEFVFRINNEEVASNITITDTKWHYLAVSYNYENETAELFVIDEDRNALVNSGNTTIYSDYTGAGKVYVGRNSTGATDFFHGNIHDIRVWGKARSLAEYSVTKNQLLSGSEVGLLYNWRMDEADGFIAEEHIRRRDAVLYGPEWQIDPNGNAVQLNGGDNHVKVAAGDAVITGGMDFTLEFWFNSTQAGSATLFSNGTGENIEADSLTSWNINKDADGKIHVKNYSNDFIAVEDNFFDGTWHHFALVLQRNGNLAAYIDGDLQNSVKANTFKQLAGSHVYLGARGYRIANSETIENGFVGKMDEFRLWSSSRKLEQIRRDRLNRMKGDEFGLMLYLPFEDYQADPTGVPILTPTFDEQIHAANHTVTIKGAQLINETPTIKLQRPVEAVEFTFSVNGDQIILTPGTSQELIENVTLDITVKNVKDLQGNSMESPKTWIAYIDKNQVIWQDDLLQFSKIIEDTLSFESAIINEGGAAKMFDIENIPDWLTVTPSSGTIPPNSVMKVHFEVDPYVNIGNHQQDIHLITDFNFPEKLTVELKVRDMEPDWSFNPNDFENSMGIIGMLKVKNVTSTDVEDKLVAKVNGEVRGVQYVQYVDQLDAYMVFMDVYSNTNKGDSLKFEIWDASAGIVYSNIQPEFLIFESNTLVGSTASPQVFGTNDEIAVDIPVSEGWNWITHFLYNTDSTSLAKTLVSLKAMNGDEIKGQTGHSNFNTQFGWTGLMSVQGIRPEQLYKLKVGQAGVLSIKGNVINPEDRTIALDSGWNWIGFISIRNQSVTQALGNLNPSDGDIIKGKAQFAVYDSFLGWMGSLQTMVPGRGYMYKSEKETSFHYPIAGMYKNARTAQLDEEEEELWPVAHAKFANNMTGIAKVDATNCNVSLQGYKIGVFDAEGNTRAVSDLTETEDSPLAYLTIAGDVSETLNFSLLNPSNGKETPLGEILDYVTNGHIGSVSEPMKLTLTENVCEQLYFSGAADLQEFSVYPSVFDEYVTLSYNSRTKDNNAFLSLKTVLGETVYQNELQLVKGNNTFRINLQPNNLQAGMYLLELQTKNGRELVKIIKK